MAIFKKKEKEEVVLASAPEEEETEEEIKHIEELSKGDEITGTQQKVEERKVMEVPVCLSQTQINNVILENNFMLKRLIVDLD